MAKDKKIEIVNRIGDKFYMLLGLGENVPVGRILRFFIDSSDEDEISDISIDEDGVHYLGDYGDEILPENGMFFTRKDGNAFLKEHCGEFNEAKIKCGTAVYHHYIKDHIVGAKYSHDDADIVIQTAMDFELRWKDKDKTFFLTPPEYWVKTSFAIIYTYDRCSSTSVKSVVGVFPDYKTAADTLAAMEKNCGGQIIEKSDSFFEYSDSKQYDYPTHRYAIEEVPDYSKM